MKHFYRVLGLKASFCVTAMIQREGVFYLGMICQIGNKTMLVDDMNSYMLRWVITRHAQESL